MSVVTGPRPYTLWRCDATGLTAEAGSKGWIVVTSWIPEATAYVTRHYAPGHAPA